MGDFFHGWRRKAGCVLLVIALPLMCAWIRSFTIIDGFNFGDGRFSSSQGSIQWLRISMDQIPVAIIEPTSNVPGDISVSVVKNDVFWKETDLDMRISFWVIHYWIIVIPLTLLAAYLILWPGKRIIKQPKLSEAA